MLLKRRFILVFSFPSFFSLENLMKKNPDKVEDKNVEDFLLRGAMWRERG